MYFLFRLLLFLARKYYFLPIYLHITCQRKRRIEVLKDVYDNMDYNGSRTEAKYWMYRIRYDDWEAWYAAVAFPHSNKIDLLIQKYREFDKNPVATFRQMIIIFDRKCEKCDLYYIMYESGMRFSLFEVIMYAHRYKY